MDWNIDNWLVSDVGIEERPLSSLCKQHPLLRRFILTETVSYDDFKVRKFPKKMIGGKIKKFETFESQKRLVNILISGKLSLSRSQFLPRFKAVPTFCECSSHIVMSRGQNTGPNSWHQNCS